MGDFKILEYMLLEGHNQFVNKTTYGKMEISKDSNLNLECFLSLALLQSREDCFEELNEPIVEIT